MRRRFTATYIDELKMWVIEIRIHKKKRPDFKFVDITKKEVGNERDFDLTVIM